MAGDYDASAQHALQALEHSPKDNVDFEIYNRLCTFALPMVCLSF